MLDLLLASSYKHSSFTGSNILMLGQPLAVLCVKYSRAKHGKMSVEIDGMKLAA
jgi:hypothetical protein